MIAKKGTKPAVRSGGAVIESALNAFKALNLAGWEATQIVEEFTLFISSKNVVVKTVGLRIARVKVDTKKQGWIEKLVRDLEPAIVLGPLYEDAKTHCVSMSFVIAGRLLSAPEDSLYAIPFKREIKKIFSAMEVAIPELKYRG